MKKLQLSFLRTQLLDDNKNTAYIISRSWSQVTGTEERDVSWLTDICEDGNIERVTRILNLVFRFLEMKLYKFSAVPAPDDSYLDDTYGEPEKYTMYLKIPDDFAKVSVQLAKNLIHEIMVYRVLWEWCSLTHHTEGMSWMGEKVEKLLEELHSAINKTNAGYIFRKASGLGI